MGILVGPPPEPPPPDPPWDWQIRELGRILTDSQLQTVLGRLRAQGLIPKTTTRWPNP